MSMILDKDFMSTIDFADCVGLWPKCPGPKDMRPMDIGFSVCGREYEKIEDLTIEKIQDCFEKRVSVQNYLEVSYFHDKYGCPVLRLYRKVPGHEMYDNVWDDYHILFLLHDGKQIFGIYCTGGSAGVFRMSKYENLIVVNSELGSVLKELDFPLENTTIVEEAL